MPNVRENQNQLPGKVERILASLSAYYARHGKSLLQKVIVNAAYHVEEDTEYDNWNGGQTGHTVVFHVPPDLFYEIMDEIDSIARDLCGGMNQLAMCDHEFVAKVRLEIKETATMANWREKSGLLVHNTPLKTPGSEDELQRLWRPGFCRVFLSHKSEFKKQTSALKTAFSSYGLTAFVAHEDIEPTKAWQDEIEKALFSMHLFVAVMSDKFHDSHWTDQEIGVAIGRGVPVISAKWGADPYGFIGKYQALQALNKPVRQVARELAEAAFAMPDLKEVTTEALISCFEQSQSFNQSNELMDLLEANLQKVPPDGIRRLEIAANNNSQLRDAFEVQSRLRALLKRLRNGT